jgi:hypothetical protein
MLRVARFLHRHAQVLRAPATIRAIRRWITGMNENNGMFGLVVGGLVALAAALFILGGGDWGGKKTIDSDQDLPPVADGGR